MAPIIQIYSYLAGETLLIICHREGGYDPFVNKTLTKQRNNKAHRSLL